MGSVDGEQKGSEDTAFGYDRFYWESCGNGICVFNHELPIG